MNTKIGCASVGERVRMWNVGRKGPKIERAFDVVERIWIVFQVRPVPDNVRHFIFFFCHWTAMAGTLLNPLVYAYYNENFRRQIQVSFVFFEKRYLRIIRYFSDMLWRNAWTGRVQAGAILYCLRQILLPVCLTVHLGKIHVFVIEKLSEQTTRKIITDKTHVSNWLTIKLVISKFSERIFNYFFWMFNVFIYFVVQID